MQDPLFKKQFKRRQFSEPIKKKLFTLPVKELLSKMHKEFDLSRLKPFTSCRQETFNTRYCVPMIILQNTSIKLNEDRLHANKDGNGPEQRQTKNSLNS